MYSYESMDFETVPQSNLFWTHLSSTGNDWPNGDLAVSTKELSLFDRESHLSRVIIYDISHILDLGVGIHR